MFFHLSFLAVVIVVAWAFHRYQLVSDHLIPFVKRKFPRMNQYTQLQSFSSQAGAGVSPLVPPSPLPSTCLVTKLARGQGCPWRASWVSSSSPKKVVLVRRRPPLCHQQLS